jgi:glycosyltransferase involved in cell wall biosynthesis
VLDEISVRAEERTKCASRSAFSQKVLFMTDCLLFATADWDAPYWTNKQHTAVHLAKAGFRVLYIESVGLRKPTANSKDLKRIWQRLKNGLKTPRPVSDNIWVLSPLVIPFKHHLPIMRFVNRSIMALQIKWFMWKEKFKTPLIWTYHPFMLDVVSQLPHDKIIYHCVDDLASVPGIDASAFLAEEEKLLKTAQAVFVTSHSLLDRAKQFNANAHYQGNVADIYHFGKARESGVIPPELECIPHPRIGYIGALSDYKVDFDLMLCIAKQKPEWHWVLIGDEREGQDNATVKKLRALANMHFLGHRSYQQLPDYLRGMDVATLPTLINDYTRAMTPMKYIEYLAAGLPIVSTPLAFTEVNCKGMEVAATPEAFAAALEKQLARGKLTDAEVADFVGEHTWEKRLQKMFAQANINIIK